MQAAFLGILHAGTFNNNAFTLSAGLVAFDIFTSGRVAELNARASRMKRAITRVLFDAGLYSSKHAVHVEDVHEIDSFDGPSRLYLGLTADAAAAAATGGHEDENTDCTTAPLPKMYLSSQGNLLSMRFTGSDSGQWHNLYYHFMLDRGIYLASRAFTPLNLEVTDDHVDMFVTAVRDFVTLHRDDLIKIS